MLLPIILIAIGAALVITAIVLFCLAEDCGGVFLVGVVLLGIGIYTWQDAKANEYPRLTADEACDESNAARPLPAPGTVRSVKDDRVGNIYACNYLADLGLLPGKRLDLMSGLSESEFTDSSFKASGDLRGWMLLGIGELKGSMNAEGKTERKNVYAFRVQASTGTGFTKVVLPTERVSLVICPDNCTPFVVVTASDQPLYAKPLDDHRDDSIWLSLPTQDYKYSTVRRVSNTMPGDRQPSVTGGPRFTGEVLGELATNVQVHAPADVVTAVAVPR